MTLAVDTTSELQVETDRSHTAAAVGNKGVEVISTPALILMLEDVSERAMRSSYEDGEASVGTLVNVRHVGAALAGAVVTARARVAEINGRRVLFDVDASASEKLLMTGQHERAVVDLKRFLASQGLCDTAATDGEGGAP